MPVDEGICRGSVAEPRLEPWALASGVLPWIKGLFHGDEHQGLGPCSLKRKGWDGSLRTKICKLGVVALEGST